MKYTPATIAKAITAFFMAMFGAAVSAAHGGDIFAIGASSWFSAIATGVVAGLAVFAVPNKTAAVNNPAQRAATGLQDVAQQYNDLVNSVNAGLQQVQQTATSLGSAIPGVMPGINAADSLAEAAIRAATNPGQYRS